MERFAPDLERGHTEAFAYRDFEVEKCLIKGGICRTTLTQFFSATIISSWNA